MGRRPAWRTAATAAADHPAITEHHRLCSIQFLWFQWHPRQRQCIEVCVAVDHIRDRAAHLATYPHGFGQVRQPPYLIRQGANRVALGT
jgi:hypothetical protein